MVSPFTLGLFAPLPLAMMIPFMATQSLAMGEAFGKSFQFGKRKISSMSNEEFNKLTIQDIMNEQTANIKSLIPMLAQQMNDSNKMQEKVFQEMTKLIPAFIKGLGAGTQDIIETDIAALATPSSGSIADRVSHIDTQPLVNWLTALTKLSATNALVPKVYAHTDSPPPTLTVPDIPEFGDQSPPDLNDPLNDPEFVKAKNDLAYRKAQEDKRIQAITAADDRARAIRNQPSASALRKTAIAESGLSPLAYGAVQNFKNQIDTYVRLIKSGTDFIQIIKKENNLINKKYPNLVAKGNTKLRTVEVQLAQRIKKLSALRIKFKSTYGYYY